MSVKEHLRIFYRWSIDRSAELFTYNPTLTVTMSTETTDAFIVWYEAEPQTQ